MAPAAASVLAINGGSSSIKFAVYPSGTLPKPSLSGKLDRINVGGTTLSWHATEGASGEGRKLRCGHRHSYRMCFTISPQGHRSRLVVFIDYQLPPGGFSHWLGLLFGRAYEAWCTRRMTTDAVAARKS